LRNSIDRWRQVPLEHPRELYRSFIKNIANGEVAVNFLQQINVKLNISNPDYECRLDHEEFRKALWKTIEELQNEGFFGVCFLVDGAEFIARRDWATDTWNYFRSLKDTKNSLKPYFGMVLSGYRELKDYQQKVGSPLLGIAAGIKWLSPLEERETKELISLWKEITGIPIHDRGIQALVRWTGCHPYLTHLALGIVNDQFQEYKRVSLRQVIDKILYEHSDIFVSWWNPQQEVGRLDENDRKVYAALAEIRTGSPITLAQHTRLGAGRVKSILDVLTSTGIVRKQNEQQYTIGACLFEEWLKTLGYEQSK
ncbi:MAG: ATP-binding protein, partial [Cyanobacteria bacterium J06638_22]